MQYLLVGIGGALGSLARFKLGLLVSNRVKGVFPWGTFIINILGAFLLGILITAGIGENLYLLLADGFLGAYTTFSTFMYEGFNLFGDNKKLNAIVYISASVIIGIIGFIGGIEIVNLVKLI